MTTPPKGAVKTFGKYQILERIATGGMAEIYKARVETIGGFQRLFAIKRILPHLSQNQDYVSMLVEEAKVAGLLTHANIVQILDLGKEEGIWYIAMEHVEGRDLGAVLRRARERSVVLPFHNAVFVAIELLKGLEYAHQRQVMRGGRPVPLNIIHRDISPPNILLSFQGEVKLTDFGIARANHKVLETQSGIIKGRFDYMSPEQAAAAKDLDQRSDLFSVGVVLYEMLTGEHPFRTESEFGTLDRIRSGKYIPVSARNPEVPFVLETIVDRSLRADRNERYPSATALKEALDKFFHDSGFLFTHSNLATYLKLLYPEIRSGASIPPEGPKSSDNRRAHTPSPSALSESQPRPISLPPNLLARDGDGDTTRSFDARRPEQSDSTESKPPEDETHALVKSPARQMEWADEGETVIRPQPVEIRAVDSLTNSNTHERIEVPPMEPTVFTPPVVVEQGSLWWSPLVGAIGFGIGVVFGAAIGVATTLAFVGERPTEQPSWVQVDVPAAAKVLIDGQEVHGRVQLQPDVPHAVRIELNGKAWEQSLLVVPGEGRTITLVEGHNR